MKTLKIAAAAALLSGPALAADPYSGSGPMTTSHDMSNIVGEVSLWVGAGFVDSEDSFFDADSVFNYGGDGRTAWNMGNGNSLQFELQGRGGFTYNEDGGSDPGADLAYVAATVHGFMPSNDNTYGGYVSLYGGPNVSDTESSTWLGGAVEAASFMGSGTLFGQLGGGFLVGGSESADSHYFGRAGWRHLFNDYTKLEIDGLIGGFSGDGGEGDGWYANWGAEFEHQYMGTPFAAFVAYRGYFIDQDDPGDSSTTVAEHVVKVGGTLRFGGNARTIDRYMPFDAADHSNLLFADGV